MLTVSRLAELLGYIGKKIDVTDPVSYAGRIRELYEKSIDTDLLQSFINEIGNELTIGKTVRLNSDKTLKILGGLGFTWPECDEGYISRLYGDIDI